MGLIGSACCFVFVTFIKRRLNVDDSLDTFGIHGLGGTIGAVLTGVFATPIANENLIGDDVAVKNGLAKLVTDGGLWIEQSKAVVLTMIIAFVGTAVIAFIVKKLVGFRPTEEQESQGLDITDHGEDGYVMNA